MVSVSQGTSRIADSEDYPLNNVNPHYMHVQAHVGSGFTNQAYEGIFLEEGHSYRLSFYARSEQNFKVQVAALERVTGKKHILTNVLISNNDWHKYTVSFTVNETIRYALFAIYLKNRQRRILTVFPFFQRMQFVDYLEKILQKN